MDLRFMVATLGDLLEGVPLLLWLVGVSVSAGIGLAVLLAVARLSRHRVLAGAAAAYVFVFRGTPLLVQIFLIYYGLGQFEAVRESVLWPALREPWWCAVLALTLNTAAYGSEIIRGGLRSVPWGQLEAARACGMSGGLLFRRITMPVALRQALPAYGNELILMVKATSLASVITLMEVTGIAHRIISETFRVIEVFVVAGGIYLLINFVVTRVVLALEVWLSPHLREARIAPIATAGRPGGQALARP